MSSPADTPADTVDPFAQAQARGREAGLSYRGALTPAEAWAALQATPEAVLVDVRTDAELELVGRVPGAVNIEWKLYPEWTPNPSFVTAVQRRYGPQTLLLLLCRSGVRSHEAAVKLAAAGYENVYQVLEGFEGELDDLGQRRRNGWRAHGLPWTQA